jgi:hypothetical protein
LALESATISVHSLFVGLWVTAGKPVLVVASELIAFLTTPGHVGFGKCKNLSNFWMTEGHSEFNH